jgi:enterobactin synthetase component D
MVICRRLKITTGFMAGYRKANAAVMSESVCEADAVEHCLRRWLPGETFVKAARIDDYPILPEEQTLVARAVDRRRREFATGRWLARQALRSFGLPDRPIMMGPLRNPLWPDSVIGAISHDGALCAVALSRKSDASVAGIGIDLVSLPPRIGRMDELAPIFVASAQEMDAVAALDVAVDQALLLFSLKESVIKAISPRFDDFIDMRAIEVRRAKAFEIHIAGTVVAVDLFAAVTGGYLVTAACLR